MPIKNYSKSPSVVSQIAPGSLPPSALAPGGAAGEILSFDGAQWASVAPSPLHLFGMVNNPITSVNGGSTASVARTILGAAVGDLVVINPPAPLDITGDLGYYAYVSATDTVTLTLTNSAGLSVSVPIGAQGNWPVAVIKDIP